MFGVLFPDRSFPMDASSFTQIDTFHWILDLTTLVPNPTDQVRDVCVFLLGPASLPACKALAVYAQPADAAVPFAFCGAVTHARPSAVLALPDAAAKVGVCVEDAAALALRPDAGAGAGAGAGGAAAAGRVERVAMRVGENLFNFMQSFCGVDGSRLVVPMDILDRWFKKFQERAKRDPEYLKGFAL